MKLPDIHSLTFNPGQETVGIFFSLELRRKLSFFRKILPISLFGAIAFALMAAGTSPKYLTRITVTVTGNKTDPAALASVVWLSAPRFLELLRRNFDVRMTDAWDIQNDVLICNRKAPAVLELIGYLENNAFLMFYKTPYSGEAIVRVNGMENTVRLYAVKQELETLHLTGRHYPLNRSFKPTLRIFTAAFLQSFLVLSVLAALCYPIYRRLPDPWRMAVVPISLPSARSRISLVLLTLLIFTLLCLTFYPGVMTIDSYIQYSEAKRFQFRDWHPPIMGIVWKFTDSIIPGSGGMFLLQIGALVCSAYLLSYAALLRGKKLFFLPLLVPLLPMITSLLPALMKDIPLAVFFLLSFCLWYYCRLKGRLNKRKMLLIFVCVFYAASVRLNALPAAFPLIFLFCSDFRSKRTTFLYSVVIWVVFYFANDFMVYRLLHAQRTYRIQTVMSQDMMAIYQRTGRNYFPGDYLTKKRLDELMLHFSRINSDPITFVTPGYETRNPAILKKVTRSWMSAILHEPGSYLDFRWEFTKHFLLDADFVAVDKSFSLPSTYPYQEVKGLTKMTSLGKIQLAGVFWVFNHLHFLFQTWFYMAASVLILVLSMKLKVPGATALSTSSLLYIVPFFFTAPAPNYRFAYWPVFTTLVSLLLFWIESPLFVRSPWIGVTREIRR